MAPIVNLDLDGVVANFASRAGYILTSVTDGFSDTPDWNERMNRWDFWENFGVSEATWNHIFSQEIENSLWANLLVYRESILPLWKLDEAGFRIRILTTRLVHTGSHKDTATQTVEWLDRNHVPYHELCLVRDTKAGFVADYAIDDKPQNIIDQGPFVRQAFLLDRPWNQEATNLMRVATVAEFADRIINVERIKQERLNQGVQEEAVDERPSTGPLQLSLFN